MDITKIAELEGNLKYTMQGVVLSNCGF